MFYIIRTFHQLEQSEVCIISKSKSAQFRFFIFFCHFRVRTDPCSTGFIFSELRNACSKGHGFNQFASVSWSEYCFFHFCNRHPKRHRRIITRRAAYNQHIHTTVMLCHKSADCQRTHTVSHKDHRKIRVCTMNFPVYCADIF